MRFLKEGEEMAQVEIRPLPLLKLKIGEVGISALCTIRDTFDPPESIRNLMPVIPPGDLFGRP